MKTFLLMAWRNIWRNKRRTLILSVAVIIGVGGMVFALGFMNGYLEQIVDNNVNPVVGHIQIHETGFTDNPRLRSNIRPDQTKLNQIKDIEGIEAFAFRIKTNGMISSARYSSGVQIMGVQPDAENEVASIPNKIVEGRFLKKSDKNKIVLGQALFQKLKVREGSKVVLMAGDKSGEIASAAFRVVGVFDGPSEDLEKRIVYITLDDAQRIFGLQERISEIVIRMKNRDFVSSGAAELKRIFGENIEVLSWKELIPAIVQMVEFADNVIYIFYLIIFISMAFGIVNVFLMAVMERIREFGIMKSLGLRPMHLVFLVSMEGLFLGTLAIFLGVGVGALIIEYFDRYGLDLSFFGKGAEFWGFNPVIYPIMGFNDYLEIIVFTLALTIIVNFYPAFKAAGLKPVEALRHV